MTPRYIWVCPWGHVDDDGLGDVHGCCTVCGGELKRQVMPPSKQEQDVIGRKHGRNKAAGTTDSE